MIFRLSKGLYEDPSSTSARAKITKRASRFHTELYGCGARGTRGRQTGTSRHEKISRRRAGRTRRSTATPNAMDTGDATLTLSPSSSSYAQQSHDLAAPHTHTHTHTHTPQSHSKSICAMPPPEPARPQWCHLPSRTQGRCRQLWPSAHPALRSTLGLRIRSWLPPPPPVPQAPACRRSPRRAYVLLFDDLVGSTSNAGGASILKGAPRFSWP